MIVNIVNEWQIATAVNGNEINVRIVPHVRKQNSLDGYRWVEVGKKIQLQTGEEIELNQDGKSFYAGFNQQTSCESKNHLNLNFMRYQKLNRFSDSEFQRLVGVPRPVFSEMIEVLKEVESLKKKSGRPHTLAIEDQLLLTLNYLRNYSTQLELAANYHIAESNVNRTIKKVEDALMKSRRFTLPKRSITTADEQFNWVIIDATECSIERPKKKSE